MAYNSRVCDVEGLCICVDMVFQMELCASIQHKSFIAFYLMMSVLIYSIQNRCNGKKLTSQVLKVCRTPAYSITRQRDWVKPEG